MPCEPESSSARADYLEPPCTGPQPGLLKARACSLITAAVVATSILSSCTPVPAKQSDPLEIVVGPERTASADPSLAFSEPHIAVDPRDPARWAIVAIAGFTQGPDVSGWNCSSFRSIDGGETWLRFDIEVPRCADPVVSIDRQGTATAVVLAEGIRVFTSDLDRDWSGPLVLSGSDHPTIVNGPGDGSTIAATLDRVIDGQPSAGLAVYRSTEDQRSYQPIAEHLEAGLYSNAITPALVGSADLIYGGVRFARQDGEAMTRIDPAVLWTVRETDRGLDRPVEVTQDCATRVGFPTLAGGPEDAYLVCIGAGALDVLVFASGDRGRTWGGGRGVFGGEQPVLDHSAVIDRADPLLRRVVGAAVNSAGVLGVVWQDREADTERRCQHQMFAASADKGQTFATPVRVSQEPSCPDNPENVEAGSTWPGASDYGAIAAASDGSFVTTWADARGGAYQIMAARIQVNNGTG